MIESINKQKTHLLDQLRQVRDEKLVLIRTNMEAIECYFDDVQNVQVNNKPACAWW